jgi:alpha-L-fucosidase 2
LYPGNVISVKRTPALIEPVKKVLEERGDEGAGFSRAWKMSLWARLYDGERALKIFKGYLAQQCFPQLFAKCFKPLQVDGTLGVTAAVTEMLMQSHEGIIDLLPALPAEWSEGKFTGMCARGAFEVSAEWEKSKITKVVIVSGQGGMCSIDAKIPVSIRSNGKKIAFKSNGRGAVTFSTQKGAQYVIMPK